MAANVQLPGFDDASPVRQNSAIRQLADQVNTLAPIESPVFTGDPQAPTPSTADNDTSIATTAYVKANLANYAPLASPALTGNPTAPTPSPGDNDTSIATTAFVTAAVSGAGYVPTSRTVSAGTGLSGGGDLSANRTFNLADTAVTPGSYTFSSITVDQQGRITAASSGTVTQPTTSVLKTGSTARSSSTTLTDDPDLVLAVAASTTYLVEGFLFYTAGGGNIHMAVTGPTGATGGFILEQGIGTALSAQVALAASMGAAGSNTTAGNQAVAFRGYITTSTTAGNATVQWNRNSGSGTTTVLPGSWFRLTKVG